MLIDFRKDLGFGLRRESRQRRDEPGLVQLVNMRPTSDGLEVVDDAVAPPLPEGASAWPWPQYFQGSAETFLLDTNTIYSVVGDSIVEKITDFPTGQSWQVADFFHDHIFLNGSCSVIESGNTIMFKTLPQVTAGVQFEARGVFGGFSEDDSRLTQGEAAQLAGVPIQDQFWRENAVWYSASMLGNVLEPFGESSGIDQAEQNDSGLVEIGSVGIVRKMIPMGDRLMVYGSEGLVAMQSHLDPEPCLLTVEGSMQRVGVVGRNAVGGTFDKHLLVSVDGDLWLVDQSGPKRLGFREFFEDMAGEVLVTYDRGLDEFYISDGVKGYLLTSSGLCELSTFPTSVARVGGSLVGPTYSSETLDDAQFLIETESFDVLHRRQTTATSIQIAQSGLSGIEVSLRARRNPDGDWFQSDWVKVNSDGWGYPRNSGIEIRALVRGIKSSGGKIDYIKITATGWKRRRNEGS